MRSGQYRVDIDEYVLTLPLNGRRQYADNLDYEGLRMICFYALPGEVPFDEASFRTMKSDTMVDQIYDRAVQNFKHKMDRLARITKIR